MRMLGMYTRATFLMNVGTVNVMLHVMHPIRNEYMGPSENTMAYADRLDRDDGGWQKLICSAVPQPVTK